MLKHPSEEERRTALAHVISKLRRIEQAMANDGYTCEILPFFEDDLMRYFQPPPHTPAHRHLNESTVT